MFIESCFPMTTHQAFLHHVNYVLISPRSTRQTLMPYNADYENTFAQLWQPPRECSHQEMFPRLKTFLRRYACQRLHEAFEDFEPEFRMMLNNKLKEKLSEVLPKLQLDLIEDFRQREVMDSSPQPMCSGASEKAHHADHVAGQHDSNKGDESLGIGFLESLNWGTLDDPDFDVIIDMPGALDGIFGEYGSSATNDMDSTEGLKGAMTLGKTRDSGYVSTDGIGETGVL